MVPIKTDKAQDELKHRGRGLAPAERQILILCNGTRPLAEIAALMGPQAAAQVQRLTEQGFLRVRTQAAAGPALRPERAAREVVSTSGRGESGAAQAPAAAPAGGVSAPAQTPRRSLVMARMYLFDMMERIIGQQSDVVRQHLRAAATQEQLAGAIVDCLQLLVELAEPSVALRVAKQLTEMLPLDQPQIIAPVQALVHPLGVAA